MTKHFIFQSPRRSGGKPLRSNPIAEDDTRSITLLTRHGWRKVETIDPDAPAESKLEMEPEDAALARDHQWLRLVGTLSDDQQQSLLDAGYDTAEKLLAASDADLQAVKFIGAAATRAIRKAAKTIEGG